MTGVTSAANSDWGSQLNNNGVSWVALTLPYLEQNTIFNSINFQVHITDGLAQPDFATAWYTKISVLQCPSDGDQDGFRADGNSGGGGLGQYAVTSAPLPPGGGTRMVPVTNYLASFGDNYCIGALMYVRHFPDGDAVHALAQPPRVSAHRLARLPGHVRRHQREPPSGSGRPRHPPRDVRLHDESVRENRQHHRRDEQHDRGRREPSRPARRQQRLAVQRQCQRHNRADQLPDPDELRHLRRLRRRPTGRPGAPTPTRASRAITPAAGTSSSPTGRSTSSSSRSP